MVFGPSKANAIPLLTLFRKKQRSKSETNKIMIILIQIFYKVR